MPNEEREGRKRGVPHTPPEPDRSNSPGTGSDRSLPLPRDRDRSRSPPPARRRSVSPDDRDRNRRGGSYRSSRDEDDGLHFSEYYRSRFGNHAPEEYQNLRVSNIDPKVSNEDLRETLEKMDRYGNLQIKIVNSRDPSGRIAYVNFERTGDAQDARKSYLRKLVSALGKDLAVDPAGVVRDQEGRLLNSNSSGPSPSSYSDRRPSYNDRGRGGNGGYRDRDRDDGYRGGGGGGGYRDRERGYYDERGRGDRR